ncbi:DNA-processing protein DprA [Jeotgalibaca sp. MA1X17-3]|uniref:DNA-processing protein DprA n=1 Tax=Jeotgalibaca sp. MA1X17-3 TaxID=2908211 RepID=UPI001F3D3DB0|nr:DNA-processing protein DprA [Jeotgalibaca sp. MA1X17-3]UJF14785.1 DNA-processing protein DprA [Jeotgalibaca sp. MA1X17-3]
MQKISMRDRLILLAKCGTFTSNQLFLLSQAMMEHPTLSLKEIILSRNLFPSVRNGYSLIEKTRTRARFLEEQLVDREYKRLDIRVSTIYDEDYPIELGEIYHPPSVLFYQGDWSLTKNRKLGIVGSRESTLYGKKVLTQLIPKLVENKVTIVSGLAAGIDKEAHFQTISLGGRTISVIGTGLDYFYPKENFSLQKKISHEHLLVSEYPIGTPPQRYHFPMRNRIIAGLSQGILVIEAKEKSGSLITANVALQENREVFAIPGDILHESYQGTNRLIQAGAKLVLDANDILQEMTSLWEL